MAEGVSSQVLRYTAESGFSRPSPDQYVFGEVCRMKLLVGWKEDAL
jgi:hypothetical protein